MSENLEERFQDALTGLIDGRSPETEDTRATALNALADLILQTARSGSRPVPKHFNELMLALLPRVGPHVREGIARRLAGCRLLTADVARLLGADTAEIAGPILRMSPVLDRQDLLAFARAEDAEKARAIAGRTDLTADVVKALIDRQDPVIGASLALSNSPAVDEAAAERIAAIPNLPRVAARRLIELAKLSDGALAQLFWLVDGDARRQIVERIASRCGETDGTAATPGNTQLGNALFALAAAGDRGEMAARLADTLSMSRFLAARIVGDAQGEALVVALRAAGVAPERIAGIALLTVSEAGRSYDLLRTLVGLADDLAGAVARRIAGLWSQAGAAGRRSRHDAAVARPSGRAQRGAVAAPRRLEEIVADISRRTAS